jgi:hypothetical protein
LATEPDRSLDAEPAASASVRLSLRAVTSIVGAAVAAQLAAWTVLWALFGDLGVGYRFFDMTDIVDVYRPYALYLAQGAVAFRDFGIEYPPLFVPLLFAGGNPDSPGRFAVRFALVMIAFMAAAAAITAIAAADGTGPRRPYVVAGLFAAFTVLLGPISANRYDASVALVLAISLLLMMREKWSAAGVAIGIGFALKITPAMLLPLVLILAPTRRAVRALVGFTVAAAVPFLWVLSLGGQAGRALVGMLAYHLSRPLEVESVLALPIWMGKLVGIPVTVGNAAGSQVIESSLANVLATGSALVLIAALGVTFWLVWRRRTTISAEPRLIALATLATLLASLTGSKVLSPQYFVWVIPALALVAVDRKLVGVILGGTLVCTQVLFPANYEAFVIAQTPGVVALVIVRNLLVIGAFALMLWDLWSMPELVECATAA